MGEGIESSGPFTNKKKESIAAPSLKHSQQTEGKKFKKRK